MFRNLFNIENTQIAYYNMESGWELGITEAGKSIEQKVVYQTSDTYFLIDRFFKTADILEEVWLKGRGLKNGIRRDYERKMAEFWKVHQQAGKDFGRDSDIAIDSNGYPHISYINFTDWDLWYAKWDGTNWITEPVDVGAIEVGQWSEIVLLDGLPHIFYCDRSNFNLKHAWKNTANGSWNIESVKTAAGLSDVDCIHQSVVKDGLGRVHIIYGAWPGVRYLVYDKNNGYITKTYLETSNYIYHTDITLDSNNYPHISYFDWTAMQYRYKKWDGAQWLGASTIDNESIQNWQEYTNLVLDTSQNPPIPHVAYSFNNNPNNVIKYAKYNGSTWDIETVETNYYQDWSNDAMVWYKNKPWIIYTKNDSLSLILKRKSIYGWEELKLDKSLAKKKPAGPRQFLRMCLKTFISAISVMPIQV